MARLKQVTVRAAGCGALVAMAALGAGPVAADETAAREILTAMSTYLAAQQTLSFDFDSSLDVITTDDQQLTIATSGSVALQRPDKLHILRKGGFATLELAFDGKTLTAVNAEAKTAASAAVEGTIDQLITTLRDDFGRPLPAADLIGADAGEVLMAEVTEVKDLGSGVIRGQECDHLAFRTPEVDWQIWVSQGDMPVPCRLIITSKTVKGAPDYRLDFGNWSTAAPTVAFTLATPEGFAATELKDLPNLDEFSGIYQMSGGN